MATTTTNLGLTLPAGSDTPDIATLNENFSILDALFTPIEVAVTASSFALNSTTSRYEQEITVSGMTAGNGGLWDIKRSGDTLTLAESKIACLITDVIRQAGSIKIMCTDTPEADFTLLLYWIRKEE